MSDPSLGAFMRCGHDLLSGTVGRQKQLDAELKAYSSYCTSAAAQYANLPLISFICGAHDG